MADMHSSFDERAKTWDDPQKVARARRVAELIARHVPLSEVMSAFEYGCGTGLLSFALHPPLKRITLADNSEGMLAVARQKIETANAQEMSVLQLDLLNDSPPAQQFDLLYSMLALHHIDDVPRVLGAFRSMLKPGGYLCVADLDQEDGSFHGEGFKGHHGFDRTALGKEVAGAGFEAVQFMAAGELQRETHDGTVKTFSLFLMIARKPTR